MQQSSAVLGRQTTLAALTTAGIEVDVGLLARSQYAHDASNYRIEPLAVAFPRNVDDVVTIVKACTAAGVPITARGSGTGMAGNTIGRGIVIDFRRHMRRIESVDAPTRTAIVEPGVVLDDLQDAAASHGLMFGPDPSSHSRATLGGMIGNDACGNHSVAYGRTSDHIVALEVVLASGTRAVASRSGLTAVRAQDEPEIEALTTRLRSIAHDHAWALATEFERTPRQVSGYAAHRLLPAHGFDVARLLVGSEGSLAMVVSATVALVAVPAAKQLLVLGYRDLVSAARDVPALLSHHPAAIEAIDTAIIQTMRARHGTASVPGMPTGEAWLFVEFADTVATADLDEVAAQVTSRGHAVSARAVREPAERAALWRAREDGAGLASSLLDGTRGKPGWEDAAVPPHRLGEYLEGLRDLQRRHGFAGVLYGHFGAGCVHVRFDFDTDTDAGRTAMRAFIRDAAALVAHCNGSVSGEHGDGRARGELLPLMYSQGALDAFRSIKLAFDPKAMLNPGVIVDAPSLTEDMPTPRNSGPTMFELRDDAHDLGIAANRCVGIGRCVAAGVTAMCPTYGVSLDERDSTRGRARTIQDLFNGSGVTTAEALATLDSCLSCKACATDCPTGVDMATYKAELLHQHYRHRLRPLSHYTLGWLPRLVEPLSRPAPVINAVLARPALRRVLAKALGISALRRFPALANHASRAQLASLPQSSTPGALLFVDGLTRSFAPELAGAAARVLEAAGIPVQCITAGDSGLTWITTGQLDTARRVQRNLLEVLEAWPHDLPIVVLEPSAAASLAQDLPELAADPRAAAVAARVRTFTQALQELAPDWALPVSFPPAVVLQPHCHERAAFADSSQAQWLRGHGIEVTESVGCCGMGGTFGYEPGHEAMSIAVARRSLLPTIDAAAPGTALLADGFGCRCQVDDLRPHANPQHLAQLLDDLL